MMFTGYQKRVSTLFFILPVCLTAIVACERVVDLRPEGRGNIVVECVLSEEETQTLRLSLTDIASASLKDAVVSLTDEKEGVLVGNFAHQEGDIWKLDYAAIPGHRYLLTVEVEGYDPVTAHTKMPERPSVKYTIMEHGNPVFMEFEGFPDFELGIRFEITSLPKGAVWICGMNYDAVSGGHAFARTIATSLESSDLFNLTGDTYDNAYNPQSDSLYDALYEVKPEEGYITGAPSYYHYPKQYRPKMYQYVVGCPLHDTFLRIPPVTENDGRTAADPKGYFSVAGSFQAYSFRGAPSATDGYLFFVSVSDEYDRYLKELLMEESRLASMKDFADLFSRNNIFGNIENGIGIFGAKAGQKLPWNKRSHSGWGNNFKW
ncbi:MAG: DUF4249 family protein [Bacteroidales bacterium]|jgi:hypothetical protein|nr:DUF4249 family protein [Bacteroidota bacterium]NLN99952.1 DUF4249 family protein [Bacteroidales bacterium]